MHHIVFDGWSMGVLLNEMSQLYSAFARGEADPLPPLELQYADYAVWQRKWMEGDVLQGQNGYWKEALAGAPGLLELPTDHSRPAKQDYAGAFTSLELDEKLVSGLKELSRRQGTTLFMALLGGWAAVLARLSGQQDIVIGTPVANRGRIEIEKLIGFFVNTLAVRVDVSGSPTTGELLGRVKAQAIAAQQHQDIPFEQVVEVVRPERSLSHSPIFQVMFAWQNAPEGALELPGLKAQPLQWAPGVTTKFDLSLSLREAGKRIVGGLEYATSLFEAGTIERYLGYFRTLLEGMVADESRAVDRLPLLGASECHQVIEQWNETAAPYPKEKCVHELFEEQVKRTPDAVAMVFEDRQLTYAELNKKANRLARYLRTLGAGPETRVGICLERSLEMVVGLLGILKAGGAYVPLDAAFPDERKTFMMIDSEVKIVLTTAVMELPEIPRVTRINIDQTTILAKGVAGDLGLAVDSEAMAYLMYTSGSTGKPKGIMTPHRAIGRLVLNCGYADFNESDRVAFAANPAFDAATMEVWAPLLNGGRIVVVDREAFLDPKRFAQLLERHGVTALFLTTAIFNQYALAIPEALARLRYVFCGGEKNDPSSFARVLEQSGPQHLVHCYGPTETTTFAITHEVTEVPEGTKSIPLGRPISNTQIYILDGNLQPTPIGVTGEIFIGGAGVAHGYLNRLGLTAESFFGDPFTKEAGARMYKTGDLARWLADGTIEFLGRNDFQVKIRGFRVELEEIEARLAECGGVGEAVVVAREDMAGDKWLVAYYTCEEANGEVIGAEELREYLGSKLPQYMAPAAYVRLERLPLTPNGKVDRKALPAPEGDAYVARRYEAPRTPTEEALAQIWAEALSVDQVGRHDNFFELGGHSLLGMRFISRLRQTLSVEVTISELFAYPVLGDFARVVERAAQATLPAITLTERGAPLPLSFAQQRLWFLAQMEGVSRAYHISWGVRLEGELDHSALRRTLDRIVARHEALRNTFVLVGDEAAQSIAAIEESRFQLVEHDLRERGERGEELDDLIAEEALAEFDLQTGPLIRGRLIRLSEDEHTLLITMHHIVSDGWSMGVLLNELSQLYSAFARGEADPLPPLELQYADYAVWQRKWMEGAVLQGQIGYWKEALAGAPGLLELPTDHSRPAKQDYTGAFTSLELDEKLVSGLKELSRRQGTTLFMALLGGWAAALARLSGQQDIVIGTPVANRGRIEIEKLIGFFVNTLAVRVDVSGSPTTGELLGRVKAQAIAAQQHQDIPFEQVVEVVRPERSLSHSPIFQVMFAWQNAPEGALELPGLKAQPLQWAPGVTTKFDLSLFLREAGNRIVGGLEYATSLFEAGTIERYLEYFRRLLEGMVADTERPISELPLLSEVERLQLLEEWNATEAEYPREKLIHELFEEQVEKSPEAVALNYEDEQLSYAELNARANRLAHLLIAEGVGPEDVVGLTVERSLEMIVGLLGILKAGAAYLPIEPDNPAERIAFMLEDAEVAFVLTRDTLRRSLPQTQEVLSFGAQEMEEALDQAPSHNPMDVERVACLLPQHAAYVIYTSGSTGKPKGVAISHRSICNHMSWICAQFSICERDCMLQKTSFSFDASVWEFYAPLLTGGRMVIARPGGQRDTAYLINQINVHRVSLLQVAPSLLSALIEERGWEGCGSLRAIFCGGEALSEQLQRQFQERQDARLVNLYGPTEVTIDATYWEARTGDECVAIGQPVSNTQAYVLGNGMEVMPAGVRGELYLGGEQLARCYLNRPGMTAERFVLNPFSREPGARLYRTGDLARWRADGNLEFLGRVDQQVKIRGFRIEMEEIEAILRRHAGVGETVVVAREDMVGDKRLVAYYTCAEAGAGVVGAEELQEYLGSKLPQYMAPAAYVRLERLPLTPNGKVDRKALPAPDLSKHLEPQYEMPRTQVESILCAIWEQILGVERVGIHDDFFKLGGSSLSIIRIHNKVQQKLTRKYPLIAMFEHSTIASLAKYLINNNFELHPVEKAQLYATELLQRRRRQGEQRKLRLSSLERL